MEHSLCHLCGFSHYDKHIPTYPLCPKCGGKLVPSVGKDGGLAIPDCAVPALMRAFGLEDRIRPDAVVEGACPPN